MTKEDEERINICGFYIMFLTGVVLNCVPDFWAQMMGLPVMLVTLVAAYIYRAQAASDSLMHNHMTYVIVTFWVSSVILLVGMIIDSIWLLKMGDHQAVHGVLQGISNGMIFTEEELMSIMQVYIATNKPLLLTATAITLSPGLIYIAYRTFFGLGRSFKRQKIDNPNRWF